MKSFNFYKHCTDATIFARNLSNTRANPATTQWMEDQIKQMLERTDSEKLVKDVRIIKGEELQKMGMNLFYAVGQGAVDAPRCVAIHYQGNPDSNEIDVALVGKGLTYDTGGLNLKPTNSIETMYGDKNGACAVIGAL
jgi:leucyl aminopeptidase